MGAFRSGRNYVYSGTKDAGTSQWQEAYAVYGLSGYTQLGGGQAFGAAMLQSTGVWGDGDPDGFTNGTEHVFTKPDQAYVGWRSLDSIPALGHNGLEFSAGRQYVLVGTGFLIAGDTPDFGRGLGRGAITRDGTYYFGSRKSFANTAILSLGTPDGWHGRAMFIKSHNRAQVDTRMLVGTLDYSGHLGEAGLTYIDVLGVSNPAVNFHPDRDGMKTASIRYLGNLGVSGLYLAGEYVWQHQRRNGTQSGWYVEPGWQFDQVPWKPAVHYRFARFSSRFDALFHGFSQVGSWFQGIVAGIYAGPFNQGARANAVLVSAQPTSALTLGLQGWSFKWGGHNTTPDTSGREVDAYASLAVGSHWTIMPLLGWYKPDHSAAFGGTQLGNNGNNWYGQLTVFYSY